MVKETSMTIDIDPRVDMVFHSLFGSKQHPALSISLVNAILGRTGLPQALELTVENPFLPSMYLGRKHSRLDILYRDEKQRQVQLEMQTQSHSGLNLRILHNWTNLYARQLGKGQDYATCRPVISVWILEQPVYNQREWLHNLRWYDPDNGLDPYDNRIITIELGIWRTWLREGREDALDPLNKWLYFLSYAKGTERTVLEAQLGTPEITEAVEMVVEFTKDEKMRRAYDRRAEWAHLISSYIATGREEGIEEGKKEAALALLADGVPLEQVLRCTGLSPEDLAGRESNDAP